MALRLSIWEQFSSNHSSRFTVVGVFRSTDEASKAAETMMAVRQATIDWLNAPENKELRQRVDSGDSTILQAAPPEREFASKIGVSWEYSRFNDWYYAFAFENLLFVDGSESSMGAKPMDEIVTRLGGKAYVDGTPATRVEEITLPGKDKAALYFEDVGRPIWLFVNVICVASNEAVAATIEQEFTDYLAHCHTADGARNPEGLFDTPWQAYQDEHSYSSVEGLLRRDDLKLRFTDLSFFHLAEGFPAMLKYLRAKGCEDIRYDFVQTTR